MFYELYEKCEIEFELGSLAQIFPQVFPGFKLTACLTSQDICLDKNF